MLAGYLAVCEGWILQRQTFLGRIAKRDDLARNAVSTRTGLWESSSTDERPSLWEADRGQANYREWQGIEIDDLLSVGSPLPSSDDS